MNWENLLFKPPHGKASHFCLLRFSIGYVATPVLCSD